MSPGSSAAWNEQSEKGYRLVDVAAWFKMEDGDRELRVLHELLHWLSAKGLYVSDLHTHSDKNSNNVCATVAEKMYGWDNATHLAESKGCWGSASRRPTPRTRRRGRAVLQKLSRGGAHARRH